MFRLGMGAYANRRNNDLPFISGGISASMKSVQPQKGFSHEAVYRIRLYNLYCLFGGVLEALRRIFCGSHTHPYPNNFNGLHSEHYSDNSYN